MSCLLTPISRSIFENSFYVNIMNYLQLAANLFVIGPILRAHALNICNENNLSTSLS